MSFCCTLLDAVEYNEAEVSEAKDGSDDSSGGEDEGLGVKLHSVLHLLVVIDPGGLGTPSISGEIHNNTWY